MHLSVAEVQDMVTKGQVGYPMVEKALASLTGEGGRFANLMDKQSKSFGGMISNFQDTITIMLRDLGGEFLPGMKKILADMLTFWDNNGKMMSVSFTGFVKEIFTFFSEGFSGIASIFEMVSSFFVSTNTDTTDQLAFSWKNIFLYLDIGLKATALIFKTVGAYIAYQMVNASYSAQIAFANLKNAFSIIGLGIMATAGFIGQNIAAGITKGISLAIKGLNWLIDSLNNIPGLDIKKIGDSFKEVETINFKQASQMAGQIMGVHADLMD